MAQSQQNATPVTPRDTKDGNIISEIIKKTLDVNRYATKKTIAQGFLNVALLTANAAQLKYVLTVGESHPFYILLIVLISLSILLQVIQACFSVILASKLDINKEHQQENANKTNNVVLCLNIVIMAINILINVFAMKDDD
ncbi:ninjurin-1-like [Diorhabda sublineata]|uniref:ninjurin-1-like n=1 Tax=Diorhabda sublineata TaxID=1163346 RepID=UPI0024E165E5|nr:ninjurin-1-like [Diorhabda sublineata]XP_056636459.1 ninjurin-1-like [Diorhabda sublineata]